MSESNETLPFPRSVRRPRDRHINADYRDQMRPTAHNLLGAPWATSAKSEGLNRGGFVLRWTAPGREEIAEYSFPSRW